MSLVKSIIKCINTIKCKSKCENLFMKYCENKNAFYIILLLYHDENCKTQQNSLLHNV